MLFFLRFLSFRNFANVAVIASTFCAASSVAAQTVIRIGHDNQIHDAPVYAVARELGAKYKIEMIKFLRYADIEVALARGEIDVGTLGYANAILAAGREVTPSFTYVSGISRGGISVICRKDVKVDQWQDLKGKKFGVLTGGTAELFFDDALATHSIKRSDIPVVSFTTPGPPILQALQNRDIDCTVVYEPFGAVAVASGYGYYPPVNLADNSFRGLNSVWAVNNNFLAKNAEFVKEAVGVMIKAAEYYPQHREKMETDFQKWLEYKPEVIKVGADRFELDTKMYFESALRTAQAMKELGFIRNVPEKAKLSHYFNYSFLIANTGKSAAELGQDK